MGKIFVAVCRERRRPAGEGGILGKNDRQYVDAENPYSKGSTGLFNCSAGGTPNAASYLHRDGILGVRKLACAFDWARLNGSNNLSVTPEGCSKLQHSKAPSAQKRKTCGIGRDAGAPSKP
jgi:hypothetical protein